MMETDDDDDPGELDPEVKRRLCAPTHADLPWIRERITRETAARAAAGGGCGDTLYALCFLLYLVGDASDAALVYAAKHANFDCGCMIDRQLLTVRRGLPELRDALDPVVHARLLADLADVIEDPDSADAAATVASLHCYFGVAAS